MRLRRRLPALLLAAVLTPAPPGSNADHLARPEAVSQRLAGAASGPAPAPSTAELALVRRRAPAARDPAARGGTAGAGTVVLGVAAAALVAAILLVTTADDDGGACVTSCR